MCWTPPGWGQYPRPPHRAQHGDQTTTHGIGTHLDDFETRDERLFLPSTCFTIEPGVYVDGEIGVRSEIDVLIEPDGTVRVTGGEPQNGSSRSADGTVAPGKPSLHATAAG